MREAAIAGLVCALVAAALAWPMPLHPSEVAIGGATGDFAGVAWGLWARPMGHLKVGRLTMLPKAPSRLGPAACGTRDLIQPSMPSGVRPLMRS